MLVNLHVLVYGCVRSFLFKDAEFVKEHRQASVGLKLVEDAADVDNFVFDVHYDLVVRSADVSQPLCVVIPKQRDVHVAILFDLIPVVFSLLFVF